jgi:lipoprotein signal peptidase
MTARPPLHRLLAVAFVVIALDLAGKGAALVMLADGAPASAGPFFLTLLFNDALFAGTTNLNGMALPASVLGSLLLVAMALPVCGPLAEHDDAAPIALGLMVGAAVANPASLFLQPAGVTDFLGVTLGDTSIVFNLADVAVYAGIAMSGRTAMRVLAAHRAERSPARPRALRRVHMEREIPLAIWQDSRVSRAEPVPIPNTLPPLLADASDGELREADQPRVHPPA